MSTKLLARNTCVSLLYQAITAICGFIMPRLVITYYGTTVNGLINSITQFLGIITYLDLGISAVAVSYTHLDVYKRQVIIFSSAAWSQEKNTMKSRQWH